MPLALESVAIMLLDLEKEVALTSLA